MSTLNRDLVTHRRYRASDATGQAQRSGNGLALGAEPIYDAGFPNRRGAGLQLRVKPWRA